MNYGEIKKNDIANGVGVRTSLFVSGCRHHCKNCFNKQTWDFSFGAIFNQDTVDEILEATAPAWINGVSILGGEPFEPENQQELLKLTQRLRTEFPDKDIWCYSGFTIEQILGYEKSRAFTDISKALLETIDVLVDGPFIEEKKNISLAFRGSENQRIIDVKNTILNNEIILLEL